MTVFVLNIHFKGGYGKKVPACLRSFFLNFLGRLLRVTNEATEQEQSDYYNVSCKISLDNNFFFSVYDPVNNYSHDRISHSFLAHLS